MSVEVKRYEDPELDGIQGSWNALVERSPMGTIFHRWEALRVVAEHSGATLHPLVGYKGEEPVGVFPLFEINKGPVTTVFSPPPGMALPRLGPVLFNYQKLKQRRFEKQNVRFIEGCTEWVEERLNPKYFHVVMPTKYDDVRPFQWNEFDVEPKYTYDIDLTMGEEALLESFTRDARSSISKTPEDAYTIERQGIDGLDYVLERVNSRYEDTDGGLHLEKEYVADLYSSLPDGGLYVYVASVDDRPVSGSLTLQTDDTVSLWQGSPKPSADIDVPINDLLNWRSMCDGIDEGKLTWDFVGANTPYLCKYKSKFNPVTTQYFKAERGTRAMNVVSDLYKRFS